MMIMPNYRLRISLIRPRKLDTCAPQHIITKWPKCIGEKIQNTKCAIAAHIIQRTFTRSAVLYLTYSQNRAENLSPHPETAENIQGLFEVVH